MKRIYMIMLMIGAMMMSCNPKDDDNHGGNNPNVGNEQHNGHEYVDLGLPSGLKWATCNVGANSPEDYGNYYAWGETQTALDNNYIDDNCGSYGKSLEELRTLGYIDENNNLTPQYDAAAANWGGNWRMPTKAECRELVNICTWKWARVNRVFGLRVTGPNGNSIFLPAAGYRYVSSLYYAESYGYYWSSTPDGSNTSDACYLFFTSGGHRVEYSGRFNGHLVRPVSE